MNCTARTVFVFLLFSVCAAAAFPAAAQTPKSRSPFGGKLWKSLLYGHSGPVTAGEDSAAFSSLPPATKKRLAEYAARLSGFRSRLGNPPPSDQFELTSLFHTRQEIERGIVALAAAPGIEDEAARFARETRLFYEWEGMSDGPLTEAAAAESFLSSNPETPLKPFILLFLLHRHRCAYECLVSEKNGDRAKQTAADYHALLVKARAQTDPLAVLAVDDLDGMPGNIYEDSRYTGGPVRP